MDERIVVADASALITLAAVGAFDLLRRLFNRITVTTAVRNEVLTGQDQKGARELRAAIEQGWVTVAEGPLAGAAVRGLGRGEASVLALAQCHEGLSLLLLDDLQARSRARALGNSVTGVVGILLMAKRRGLIPEVGAVLKRMRTRGFRLSDRVLQSALAEAGEGGAGTEL